MEETSEVRHFGYRIPRYGFPRKLRVEITREGTTHLIAADGIDVSADGIAVALSEPISVDTPVMLAIPAYEDTVVTVPGRVSHQSGENYCITFEFSTTEQWDGIQNLISVLTHHQ